MTSAGLQAWLALLVEDGEQAAEIAQPWFSDLIDHWREQAEIRDLGCTLHDDWSSEQVNAVTRLATRVRSRLPQLGPTTGGVNINLVDQVADAFIGLISETLPPDPLNGMWFVGASPGWKFIPRPHIPTWGETIPRFRETPHSFGAPMADLLHAVQSRWGDSVIVSWKLILFPPGIGAEFIPAGDFHQRRLGCVLLSWSDGTFEVRLISRSRLLITADRCRQANAEAVLESFLLQLAGDPE
jgi:hypothetical protein